MWRAEGTDISISDKSRLRGTSDGSRCGIDSSWRGLGSNLVWPKRDLKSVVWPQIRPCRSTCSHRFHGHCCVDSYLENTTTTEFPFDNPTRRPDRVHTVASSPPSVSYLATGIHSFQPPPSYCPSAFRNASFTSSRSASGLMTSTSAPWRRMSITSSRASRNGIRSS